MLAPKEMKARLTQVFSEPQATVLTDVVHSSYRDLVHTSDFNELKEIVRDLAAAQKRTELRVEELAAAQHRTELSVEELAAAQHRTELRVEELAAAQQRTELRVEELAAAQQRTEETVQHLDRSMQKLSQQVGGLSDRLGGDLEDVAYIVVHDVLGRELGWQVQPLARTWLQWNGAGQEIDLFGQAQDPARPDTTIWIVGEVKFNLTTKEVERFTRKVAKARSNLPGEVFPVCFCYRARPEVQQAVQAAGMRLVFSYGRMI